MFCNKQRVLSRGRGVFAHRQHQTPHTPTRPAPPRNPQWQRLQRIPDGYVLHVQSVPRRCLRALLPPRAAPPATVGLQVFLDGGRHGGRFPALVNASGFLSSGFSRLEELAGCVIVGYRIAAPLALDILVESGGGGSGGEQEEEAAGDGGGEAGGGG